MSSKNKKSRNPAGVLATNRKAFRDYQILERIEAGIELCGTEVKSIRQGHLSLNEAYADIKDGEAELLQLTVQPYDHGNVHNHAPTRPRRLLLHKKEITQLFSKTREKGLTIIPLKVYLKGGRVKVELGLAKGKNVVDKRETIKRRDADLEAQRAMSHRR